MSAKSKRPAPVAAPQNASTPPLLTASPAFWVRLIIIGQMVLLGLQFSPDISTNGDDAVYYILGKSLATGHGYRNIHLVNAPVMTTYPMLFPALLAITHFFTDKVLLAKILVMCFGCLVALFSFHLFRRWFPRAALPLVLLIAGSWVLNQHAVQLLSETPYIFVSMLALLLLEKSLREPHRKWLFWVMIIVSIMPMHCRSIGMAFSAAFTLDMLLQRKFKYALVHVTALVITIGLFKIFVSSQNAYLLPLLQRNAYEPDKGLATMAEMISRIGVNLNTYITQILPQAALPLALQQSPDMLKIFGFALTGLIAVGWLRNFLLPSKILSFYAFFYCGILQLWQVQWTSSRFLSCILPVLFYLMAVGIATIITLFSLSQQESFVDRMRRLSINRVGLAITWGLVLIFSFDNIGAQIRSSEFGKIVSPDWANYYSCTDWLRLNSPPNAIVVSRKAELTYLRSNRTGMNYQLSYDKQKVIDSILCHHASYIIVDGFFWTHTTERYLYPALESHPELYRIVYARKNPNTYVLEIVNPR